MNEAPSIYIKYWTDEQNNLSFQEICTWNLSSATLEAIRFELNSQLISSRITEFLPSIDWENQRSLDKWENFSHSILLSIKFPKKIWLNWIHQFEPNFQEELPISDYLQHPFPEPDGILSPEMDLLSAEVYFQAVDTLDPLEEPENTFIETLAHPTEIVINENIDSSLNDATEESDRLKVFEKINASTNPLLKQVETQLVEKLSSSISLYQAIHFTKSIFKGNQSDFQRFLTLIDEETTANQWKSDVEAQFSQLALEADPIAYQELINLVEKKFN